MAASPPPRPLRLALALAGAGLLASAAAAPPPALLAALKTLKAEAETRREDPASLPSWPDFAKRDDAPGGIASEDLVEALTRRADKDPFTDAYVRWQLSSFDLDLNLLDAATFGRLVREAPVLMANPRADGQVIALFDRVAETGPLAEEDLQQFRDLVARLDAETARVKAMGGPATAFHEWVQKRVDEHPLRSRQWLLVRLAMTTSAGWPVARLKTEVTRTLAQAASDATLTAAQRALLARQLRALSRLEPRRVVDEVTFMADGSVRVSFVTSEVSEEDIGRWLERVGG